jgi:hypothetical protein
MCRTGSPDEVLAAVNLALEMNGRFRKECADSDPSCKVEKFVLEWAETRSTEHLDQALSMVARPSKARSSSYQLVMLRSGIEARRGQLSSAKEILIAAVQRSDLDWPEMVYEALTQFESIHGDLEEIKATRQLIEKESDKLVKRRQKAQEQYTQYQPVAEPAQAPAAPEPEELERLVLDFSN